MSTVDEILREKVRMLEEDRYRMWKAISALNDLIYDISGRCIDFALPREYKGGRIHTESNSLDNISEAVTLLAARLEQLERIKS